MIELGTTSSSNDTSIVHLEDRLVGFDGDGNWSLVEGSLKLGCRFLNILEAGDFTNTLGWVVIAHAAETGVWVVRLKHEWVLLDVLESVVHETTITSLVNLVAINELLFRVGLEFAGGNKFGSFYGASSGESPA